MAYLYLKREVVRIECYHPDRFCQMFLVLNNLITTNRHHADVNAIADVEWKRLYGRWFQFIASIIIACAAQLFFLRNVMGDGKHSFLEIQNGVISPLGYYTISSVWFYSYWPANFTIGLIIDAIYIHRLLKPRIEDINPNIFDDRGRGGLANIGRVTSIAIWLWITAGIGLSASFVYIYKGGMIKESSIWVWVIIYIIMTPTVWYPMLCARNSAMRAKLKILQPWQNQLAQLLVEQKRNAEIMEFDIVERRIKIINTIKVWPLRFDGLVAMIAQAAVLIPVLITIAHAILDN